MGRPADASPSTGLGETQFRTLAETAPDAIVTADRDGRILYVNPAAEELFGYPAAAMTGEPLALLQPERFRAAHQDGFERYMATGEGRLVGTTVEVVAVRADGSEFPIELSLGGGQGADRTMFAVIRDITVRRRRERHLAAQLAVTAVLAESTSAAETGTRIVEELTRALGWEVGMLWLRDADGLLRVRHSWEAEPEVTAAFVRASAARRLAPGEGLPGQSVARQRPIWLEDLTASSLFVRSGAAQAAGLRGGVCLPLLTEGEAIGAFECFTSGVVPGDDDLRDMLMTVASQVGEHLQRRATEERLLDARTRFANAFVHAPIGMALLDDRGCWTDVNPALCRISGRDRADLLGRPVAELVDPADAGTAAGLLELALSGGRAEEGVELRLTQPAGPPVWVRLSASSVEEGGTRSLIAQVQDVTAARHVAELHERDAAELQRSNSELEAFAHVAAHDLRTPLQTISGFATLLQRRHREALDAEGEDFLRMILDSAEGSKALLTRLLAYARAGGAETERIPVDPRAVLDQVLVVLSSEVAAREAHVEVGPLPWVVGDAVQLGQVLQNLVANAIKFTPPERRPEVEVTGRRTDDVVVISVSDRGIGVAAEEAGEVFGMFRRGAAGARYEGSGIGLAVAAKVIAAHGGRLWVETRAGGGSTFSMTLPAAPEDASGG